MTSFISALNVLPDMRNCSSEYLLVDFSPSRAGLGLVEAIKSLMYV